ncbi:TetR family transcriptional regulator [Nocardia tenerifensis]|uniref:TetR family transcriptional regulator n=1 Tax=Nocardia tenerifensis TaxID=228006 RepID=A0A318K006_9NOCA|nr:TetR/AcrR family transcriptional regulator [Nocardia tenerifensis]PXX60952.1 TetR family transcriptional regulator [Nocardia tenerifensis]
MQARSGSGKQTGRTFTEEGRRAQIVAAAIEVVAEHGLPNASFAKIAEVAGLSSTGMISYHFRGKGDLIGAVATEIVRVNTEFVVGKLEREAGYPAVLRAYFAANLALLDEYPRHQRALASIVANARPGDPHAVRLIEQVAEIARGQEEWLREGQRAGAFREFDPVVMALAIRSARDAAVARAAEDPGFDPAACARELADLFDRATRKS